MGFRARQRLGQYRIIRRIAEGGFSDVYAARDTVGGVDVALKIPHSEHVSQRGLAWFRQEVRLAAQLDHPNILPIKTAGMIDDQFVVVTPLGIESLEERLTRRMARQKIVSYGLQTLEALACAHRQRIIHCDLKPANLILFPGDRIRLADFGLAKVSMRTLEASGSGTIGFIAPEQALGRPSARSDVFSAGLVLHRMMTGLLPRWPFDWPHPGVDRLRSRFHTEFEEVVRRSTELDHRRRYPDAIAMLRAYERAAAKAIRSIVPPRRKPAGSKTDWRVMRVKQFRREHGRELGARHTCGSCSGPVSEEMLHCPWCGKERKRHRDPVRYSTRCPRCGRGTKADWKYCPWCFGAAVGPTTNRTYPDDAYEKRCRATGCSRREMLPFMRYCPWCRAKATHAWEIPSSSPRCPRCHWGVLPEYWKHCPWCGQSLRKGRHRSPRG